MSPGPISVSATCSLPWSVNSWPTRSLPPVPDITWQSAGSTPEKTRSRLMRPLNWSASVLKHSATTGPSSTRTTSVASPDSGSRAGHVATATGEGSASTSRSSRRSTPMPWSPATHTTGCTRPSATPVRIAPMISSVVISSPSRYFSISASSFSATTSIRCSRADCAASARSSGMGPVVPWASPPA